jgi:AmmeMemoRadiSam system protein B
MIREPARAGMFYPQSREQCTAEARRLCELETKSLFPDGQVPTSVMGGLVPHAAWMCSGRVAGRVFAALKAVRTPQTVVLFGAMHRVYGRAGALFPSGRWRTPLGTVDVDDRLAERVLGHTNLVVEDPSAHEDEHSLEVQVPLIRTVFPQCKILPILVPPVREAVAIGESVAGTLEAYQCDAVVVGSTDLTHYGPAYGFAPQGIDAKGFAWAKDVNDRRIIELIVSLRADEVADEAASHRNACGAGAIAATMAAAKKLGATQGVVLEHTTSREVLGDRGFDGAVGYAAIVFV